MGEAFLFEPPSSWPDGASELRGGYFMGVVDSCQRQLEAARRVLQPAFGAAVAAFQRRAALSRDARRRRRDARPT